MSTLSPRLVVQQSVRAWALDEARDIEKGFRGTPSTVTAADLYAATVTGISPQHSAAAYADRMDAAMVALQEKRWAKVEEVCETWGVVL